MVVIVCLVVCLFAITILLMLRVGYKIQDILEQKNQSANKKRKSNYVLTSIIVVSFAALLFITMAIIASKQYGLSIHPDSVVITFVGIIATFIVVTNYAQVTDIKNDLEESIGKLDRKLRYLSNEQRQANKQNNIPKEETK